MSSLFPDEPKPKPKYDDSHLPRLQGSQRQRDRAEHIRRERFAAIQKLLRDWKTLIEHRQAKGRTEQAEREQKAYGEALDRMEHLEQMNHAAFWIERRENSARELLAGSEPKPGRTPYGGPHE